MNFYRGVFVLQLLIAVPVYSQAPNLVPNGSFELYSGCTDTSLGVSFNQVSIWYPKMFMDTTQSGWLDMSIVRNLGTPDYFNPCNGISWNSPNNGVGLQMAFDGNSYVGIACTFTNSTSFYRETIMIQLLESLKANRQYCAELYWSRADSLYGIVDRLGLYFSNDSNFIGMHYNVPFDPAPQYFNPQVFEPNLLVDSSSWNHLEGKFIATGGENWLTIGFLFQPALHNFIRLYYPASGANSAYAYYYIDAVRVYECDPVYEEEIVLPQFLSPNDDLKNDFYFISDSLPPGSKLSIYNRWGNEVYHSDNYQNDWDGRWQGHLLPSGTYYAVLIMPKGTRKSTYIELVY